MSLHEKILELQKEITYVSKDGENKHFKYDYVSESALIDKVMKAFSEKGLIVIPDLIEMRTFELCGKPATEVLYCYTVMDAKTGESLQSRAGGMEQGDKCAFKAMTGANKYFWLRFLQISTGDDPEKTEPALPATPIKKNQQAAQRASQPATKAAPMLPQVKAIMAVMKENSLTKEDVMQIGGIKTLEGISEVKATEVLGKLDFHVKEVLKAG